MNAQGNIKELEMNAQRNAKARRPIALSVVVWVIGALVLIGMPVEAAGPVRTSTTTQAAVTPAPTSTIDSSLSIPVSGTVVAADGTRIAVGGFVIVNSSAVTDVVGIPPFVMLTFDCSNVTATSGTGANKKTYDTKGFQVTKIRDLQPTDVIVVTTPALQTGASVLTASSWQVTVTLNFDTVTKKLTSGSIAAGNNTFTSAV